MDAQGTPLVSGTRIKVLEIALDRVAHGWTAEDIRRQHPHLSLGQIHSALAYYFDHQEEFDRQIALQLNQVERLRQQAGPSLAACKAHSAWPPAMSLAYFFDHHVPAAIAEGVRLQAV